MCGILVNVREQSHLCNTLEGSHRKDEQLNSNNMAVFHVWGVCLHNLLMICKHYSIHMYAVHVLGVENNKANALTHMIINSNMNSWVLQETVIKGSWRRFSCILKFEYLCWSWGCRADFGLFPGIVRILANFKFSPFFGSII